jgi:hypothetical protein
MGNRITFRGITVNLSEEEDNRCGVCNACRAVLGQIDAQTEKNSIKVTI